MTQLEDVARGCCQGLGMLQDWHKLRVGCSSLCHKRPGAVSSPFFKIFYLFFSLVESLQHTECHHLHEFDTPMSGFFVLSPTCFLSVRRSLSPSLPLFISAIALSPILPHSLAFSPSFSHSVPLLFLLMVAVPSMPIMAVEQVAPCRW